MTVSPISRNLALGLAGLALFAAGAGIATQAKSRTPPSASDTASDRSVRPDGILLASDSGVMPVVLEDRGSARAGGLRQSFADVIEPAMQAVVSVQSRQRPGAQQRQARPQMPFGIPFPFGEPDDDDDDDRGGSESFGSGVIVRSDGIILTNNHVVADALEVRVTLDDRREFKATIVGSDPLTDIAVLKIEEAGLAALPLARSTDLRMGDVVFALGSPFQLSQTATMGIVSAVGRRNMGITRNGYEDFVQTDAAINMGNSGGALIDSTGALVGINTAIFSRSGGNQGIGFAVPVDMARNVMEQILTEGRVTRAQLGVEVKDLDPALARSYGLSRPDGALVVKVVPGAPADVAGIVSGDLIVELDGKPVRDDASLRLDISSRKPGAEIAIALISEEGERRTARATLRRMPGDDDEDEPGLGEIDAPAILRGLEVSALDQLTLQERRAIGLQPGVEGVVVTTVERGSPAARAGLRPGVVITRAGGTAVDEVEDLTRAVKQAGNEVVRLRILRGGDPDIVALEP